MNHDKLIREYLRLRDVVLAEESRRHKEREGIIKEKMGQIESALLSYYAKESQVGNVIKAISTEGGRANRVIRDKIKLFDPHKFRMFILEEPESRLDMLQNRVHNTQYTLFTEENPDTDVPGVNVTKEMSIVISKHTKRD